MTQIYYLTVLEVRSPKSASLGSRQDINRAVFLLEAPGETLFPSPFQLPDAPDLPGPSSIVKNGSIAPTSLSSALTFCFLLPSFKDRCDDTESNQMTQDNLSFSKSLT